MDGRALMARNGDKGRSEAKPEEKNRWVGKAEFI
jgi:hypothetical protein